MMISTRGRYALRVMIDIAEHDKGTYIPLKDIAGRQQISEKYLESIVVILSKAGLLEGLRGKGGGYRLTWRPEQYTVGSILKLTEGSLAPVACLECGPNHCEQADQCRTLPMWIKLDRLIDEFFEGIRLSDLMKKETADSHSFL
ncbi:Rrf2 family transcriptional regulator [Clostridium sp. AM58-1XD]|uniref:RrF2 family transcriptional regulator n=1 Tax=Clostridium sp. AM58-1XD TaxID=2292307 RepID=UPI000E501056|nr:Rrf2 family transcriptional regulator [Clostridium sp. AM58-1XD]RGY99854.1 Rrf2 family transcriptional regulator [Clostridium sp. AM58-1XD]